MRKIAILSLLFGVSKKDLIDVFKPFSDFNCNYYVSNCLLTQAYKYHNISENKETSEFLQQIKIEKLKQDFTGKYSDTEARNLLLPFGNEDLIWILDGDEFYTKNQVARIIEYVDSKPFIDVFNMPFKNYIFYGDEYIEGFCPPRIYRSVLNNGWNFDHFYDENDGQYLDENGFIHTLNDVCQKSIPKKTIDGGIKHMTWLHSNGEKKYKYQMDYYGHCSYYWNEKTQKLEFNKDYYKKYNLPLPKILKD